MQSHRKVFLTMLGVDKGYDVAEFVVAMRAAKVVPHVAQKEPKAAPSTDVRPGMSATSSF